jgi:hypothetical protein
MYVVSGTPTPTQFPTGTCMLVRFKADPKNDEDFKIGSTPGTTLFPMDAGDDTGWVSAHNMSQFWYSNISGSAEYLYYWLQN